SGCARLFAVQPLIASDSGGEVPIGAGRESCVAQGDVAESARTIVRISSIEQHLLCKGRAAARGLMAGQIDDAGERRRGSAGAAKYHPSRTAAAAGRAINCDTGVGIGVERKIRSPSR